MARLWSCGFELQSTTAGMEWVTTNGSPSISTSTKRSGAASLRFNPTATTMSIEHSYSAINPTADTYLRFYINIVTSTNTLTEFATLVDGGAGGDCCSIRINSNDTLELWDDQGAVGVQLGSDSSALSKNTWYRIELSVVGTTVTAYIDGSQFATGTIAATFADPNRLDIGPQTSTTCDIYIDDIAINDGTGSAQTGLPGAGSIVHMYPDAAGDNATGNSGPSLGGTAYQMVDEKPTPNDATDYWVLEATSDTIDVNVDSSSTAGIGSSDTITLVSVGSRHSAAGTGTRIHVVRVKSASGGTTSESANISAGSTAWQTHNNTDFPRIYQLTSYTDPTTGVAWTPTGTNSLDNMQIGARAADAVPDVWISSLWALIEYVPNTGGGGGGTTTNYLTLLGVGA